jgi:ABC-type multidrug transport system ATPase subunit
MQITLSDIGKRYNAEWIFRHINYNFISGEKYVLLGGNGSGKSTLLQLIAGNYLPSAGKIGFRKNNLEISSEEIFKHVTIAAPYLELFEEFTFPEIIMLQQQFKPFALSPQEILEISELQKTKDKPIKYFSSGMKQRAKLSLAVLADVPLLLLDEPTSNLDHKAIEWYDSLVKKYAMHKTIIVASNKQEAEYSFCNIFLNIEDFKK